MHVSEILNTLQYSRSPAFLANDKLSADADFGHTYRKASRDCGLRGVYTLNGSTLGAPQSTVPIVYVCEADSDNRAKEIHRQVWNQNIVPFLLVVSPRSVRLYSGFRYQHQIHEEGSPQVGLLRTIRTSAEVLSSLDAFRAESIDSGRIWKDWGRSVTPESRVDRKLLSSLEALDQWLQQEGISNRSLSHSIIGKFVYLHYLRHRNILSDRKLEEWGILPGHIFSHEARLTAFLDLVERVDHWLNGSVFPMTPSSIRDIGAARLQKVARVFQGETVAGQLPLGFDAYDFSFIPIETLSVIYERFLHSAPHSAGRSQGQARGAYYTPIPLVNYMLDRLNSRKPLRAGMRVLDPACGSGVFLVQSYRKLIEQHIRENFGQRPKPTELRRLLTEHIFGIDTDEDACQIAELSLILTLLEYIEPPDLTNTNFRLPALKNRNIFCGNAFDDDPPWQESVSHGRFDWIVGNPPWIELNLEKVDKAQKLTLDWIQRHRSECPVGGNQVAEAFAWRSSHLAAHDGEIALLVPAMSLFKYESQFFRKAFFTSNAVWAVGNFANLANVLFGGRATLPAATMFYSPTSTSPNDRKSLPESVEVYSPFLANQQANPPESLRGRKQVWSITVNSSEIREIPYREIISGDSLPWKLAMWGSPLDRRVLASVGRRFKTIGDLEQEGTLVLSQGFELRNVQQAKHEKTEHRPELSGKLTVDVTGLKRRRYLMRFPSESLIQVSADDTYVRLRGGLQKPLEVCQPPHVIVSAARTFAVYSNDFLIVPARQVGITTRNQSPAMLKAIALYLNSDFVIYHQFLTTTQAGVQKTISTLKALRSLPVPFADASKLSDWEALYARFERETKGRDDFGGATLIKQLNEFTYEALKLDGHGQAAVHDLVRVKLALTRGKVGDAAVSPPSKAELEIYAKTLRDELDGFVGDDLSASHAVNVITDAQSGMIEVTLADDVTGVQPIRVWKANGGTASELETLRKHLLEQKAQWVYFNRNLRVYERNRTLVLKPLQRLHWTRTQAIEDAGEIIAETLQPPVQAFERILG